MKRGIDHFTAALAGFVLAVSAVFLFVPMAMVIAMSFDSRDYLAPFPPPALSWQWYEKFFSDSYYINGFKTSLWLAFISAFVSTVLGTAAAVFLDRHRFPGHEALTAFFLSPLIVPSVVMGFSLLIFISMLGVYDGFLRLTAGHVIATLPYTIRTALATLAGIRRSHVEAAMSLGASERQAFWSVVLPLARTGIFAGAIFAFSLSLDEVTLSLFLVDPNAYTLPVALLSTMRDNFNLTVAAASVVLMVFTAGLMIVLDRVVGLDKLTGVRVYAA